MNQDLKTFSVPDTFRGRPAWFVQLWWIVQSTLFACSPQFMFGWRRFILRLFGARIGRNVLIRPSAKVTFPWKVSIGDFAWIGDEVVLYSLGEIEIGDNAVVSQRSYLCTGSHDFQKKSFDIYSKKITIGQQAWIAANVFIGPGVNIGDACVVGACSCVFSDLPEKMICFGSPAHPIKPRIQEESK